MAGFFWYELMSTDPKASEAFYTEVVGWNARKFEGGDYTVFQTGEEGVAGVMASPPGMPSFWIGYIHTDDVDAELERIKAAGGKVMKEAWDVPTVGRMAAVTDPQGAGFMIMKPEGEGRPWPKRGVVGRTDWRELHARDWESAWAFYSGLFGWTKSTAMPMGEMGTYQLFAQDGEDVGAMFNSPQASQPAWMFYFKVPNIDAAVERVKAAGGQVLMGPHEVPGGDWVIQGQDPQGADFALVGGKS
ncbi:MAG TPA: VOC family protein [Caulobacteraceae bacterium]